VSLDELELSTLPERLGSSLFPWGACSIYFCLKCIGNCLSFCLALFGRGILLIPLDYVEVITSKVLRSPPWLTKDRVTRTPSKYGGELRFFGRVSSSCSTSGTRCVNLVTNPVISHEWGKDREVLTTSGTYPWSCVIRIFDELELSTLPERLGSSLFPWGACSIYFCLKCIGNCLSLSKIIKVSEVPLKNTC
jgi:hypothetical protein